MPVIPPCQPWATLGDVEVYACGSGCAELNTTVLEGALEDASYLLYAWSAFSYGVCELVVRPCASYGPAVGTPQWTPPVGAYAWGMWPGTWGMLPGFGGPHLYDGSWGMCGCGSTTPLARRGICDGGPSQIGLGAYPVASVVSVEIDGQIIPDSEYRVDDGRWLVREPPVGSTAKAHWPRCQRLDLPLGEDNTWAVRFEAGVPVPPTAMRACVDLACLIAQQRCDGTCAPPYNATSVTQEGVTVQMVRPSEQVRDNFPLSVRSFLDACNPAGLRHRPRVFSPDLPREVVQTTFTPAS